MLPFMDRNGSAQQTSVAGAQQGDLELCRLGGAYDAVNLRLATPRHLRQLGDASPAQVPRQLNRNSSLMISLSPTGSGRGSPDDGA